MTFDSDLSQDGSLQQGESLELWEHSGSTQRPDPLGMDHAENYQDSQVAQDGSCKDIDVPRNQELGATLPNTEDDGMDRPKDSEDEDILLQENEDPVGARAGGTPTWLSSAVLRQQTQSPADTENGHVEAEKWCPLCSSGVSQPCICKPHMHADCANSASFLNRTTYSHWLNTEGAGIHASQNPPVEFPYGKEYTPGTDRQQTRMATELNLAAAHGRDSQSFPEVHPSGLRHGRDNHRSDRDHVRRNAEWEEARRRCMIVNHPLFKEMLANHVACLRVGTPADMTPSIDDQLSLAPAKIEKYKLMSDQVGNVTEEEQLDLDRFMTEYTKLLASFKGDLQQHVFKDVTEAMMSCWELEQALHALTGATPEPGTGATMSDEDGENNSDRGARDRGMDYHDSGGYGPLVPSETERTLMERVRQELKLELKQGYRSRIEDVREEILRKRRAGKLPEGTTTVLKAWWQAHKKWPYPTEDEKEVLIRETGLELKQVNNWFINQRKRNWHSNPSTSSHTDPKLKARKSW